MELDEPSIAFKPIIDRRATMPQPPPVQLVAIEDVHATFTAGLEVALDAFYVGLLKFERDPGQSAGIIYKAENFRLCLDVLEVPAARDELRVLGVNVPSLALLEQQLVERQIEYQWQKALTPGGDTILLQDPAGNWLALGQLNQP